jgi:N-acetylglucosamine-6-phosphate deacetylase
MVFTIRAGELYLPEKVFRGKTVAVEGDTIASIADSGGETPDLDLEKYRVLPGLIDMHIHGIKGHDVMDGTPQALAGISRCLADTGVTSFVGATVTAGMARTEAAIKNVADCMGKVPGARLLGAYVEGPYIGEKYRGAHPEDFIRQVDWAEIERLLQAGGDAVRVLALAPEKAGAVVSLLRKKGIAVALGHSNATYAQAVEAVNQGATIAVHIFNGMRGLHHREPGIVGAMLTSDEVWAELIADCVHVSEPVMEIVKRCKGRDGVILVSDCMRAGGLADGEYNLGELRVVVREGVARLPSGSLAGSTLRLLDGVRNMVERVNTSLVDAVAMASINPARALGVASWLGSIEPGKKADLIAIDEDYNVALVMVGGKVECDNRGEEK